MNHQADQQGVVPKKRASRLEKLSEETLRRKTSIGNTPLHSAAKSGRINEIPSHLLRLELFLERNGLGATPLHLAAQYGHLDQIPREFLTHESLTVFDDQGNTPLHKAAGYEHIDQVPDEFLTSEYLKLRSKNHSAWTVLHHLACTDTIDRIPPKNITPLMWKARDGEGATPEDYWSMVQASTYQRVRNIPLLKSKCFQCFGGIKFSENGVGHTVNCPHCGQKTKLGLNPFASPLRTKVEIRIAKCEPAPSEIPPPPPERNKTPVVPLAELTEETIRASNEYGYTPLHRAIEQGKIHDIPSHLLRTELFMARDISGETPLHLAAKLGRLNQVPREFLTKETLTVSTTPPHAPDGFYTTGSGYKARTETALHIAARCGHADQIPKEFLTSEFLRIEATGYRLTLLHYLAQENRLDLVSSTYLDSDLQTLKDNWGRTSADLIEEQAQRQAYVDAARSEPATEKQKEKLRWFGCTWDEGITKGQASDALDECARQFPDRNADYYSRPATNEQKAMLRSFRKNPDDNRRDGPLTYGAAKDLIQECERNAQRKYLESL